MTTTNLMGILLIAALSYLLGWLRAYARVRSYQKHAIAAQDKAFAMLERAEAKMQK